MFVSVSLSLLTCFVFEYILYSKETCLHILSQQWHLLDLGSGSWQGGYDQQRQVPEEARVDWTGPAHTSIPVGEQSSI